MKISWIILAKVIAISDIIALIMKICFKLLVIWTVPYGLRPN